MSATTAQSSFVFASAPVLHSLPTWVLSAVAGTVLTQLAEHVADRRIVLPPSTATRT